MDKVIIVFIDSLILSWALIYVSSKIINFDVKQSLKQYFVHLVIQTIYLTISYLYVESFIKIIFTILLLAIIVMLLFRIDVIKAITLSFVTLCINLVSEIIYAIILSSVFRINNVEMQCNHFGALFTNLMIALFMFLLVNEKCIRSAFSRIIENVHSKLNGIIVTFSFITMITITMVIYFLYFDISSEYNFAVGLILVVTYISLTLYLFNERNEHHKLKSEYEITLESLSEYEKLYSYQRMMTHEFKNDLLVIRGLTRNSNRKLLSYIDELINIKNNNTNKSIKQLKRIPEGGLRGLLYYKMLSMEEEKINIEFQIESSFKVKDYKLTKDDIKSKLCKILGIYLDNAIQAVKDIDEKSISIRIAEEDNFLVFEIINNYCGNVDISKIYDKGYSTKECGRGYGLSIAKEIIDSDKNIDNETHIVGDKFCQLLKIKM